MKIQKIETNIKRNLYLYKTDNIDISPTSNVIENDVIYVNSDFKFQTLIGFGGAITESAGYSLSTVSEENYNKILDEYFLSDNLNYSLCRLPIGSSDFSLESYSYSNQKDLSDFSIKRDMKYIVPTIKSAQKRNDFVQCFLLHKSLYIEIYIEAKKNFRKCLFYFSLCTTWNFYWKNP